MDNAGRLTVFRYTFAALLVVVYAVLTIAGHGNDPGVGTILGFLGLIVGFLFGQGAISDTATRTGDKIEKRLNGLLSTGEDEQ